MTTSVVTGGAGFLGSHLCDDLLARGHRVICVDNLETGSLVNVEHIRSPNFVHLNLDIIDPFFIDERVDFVYHLASPASAPTARTTRLASPSFIAHVSFFRQRARSTAIPRSTRNPSPTGDT